MLTYRLDRHPEKSMYVTLCDYLRSDIESGILSAHEKLPSKRSFSEHLGVSLATIEAAYSQLNAEGYIRTEPRRGYFVNPIVKPAIPKISTKTTRDLSSASIHSTTTKEYKTLAKSTKVSDTQRIIDLSSYCPQTDTIPEKAWFKTLREVMNEEDPEQLLDADPCGSIRLRSAIATHLKGYRGITTNPENIIVGAGAQYLYLLIIQLLGKKGVWAVENPGYKKIHQIYRANSLRIAGLSIDSEGISLKELQQSGARIAHITPSHQFPTGVVMSAARRYELLGWANRADRYLIEDDYDCEFRLKGRPMPSLQSIDANEKVIYINTFSRSLWPGIRIAYLVLPTHLMRIFKESLGFYSCTVSALEQITLARFIETGRFDSHVNRVKKKSRSTRDQLIASLTQHTDNNQVRITAADNGLHFLVEAQHVDEQALKATLLDKGIRISCVSDYFHSTYSESNEQLLKNKTEAHWSIKPKDQSNTTILVNFAGIEVQTGIESMQELARAIKSSSMLDAPGD